jgi:4-hydroxythreonine-4-phosphate dehydrogenase
MHALPRIFITLGDVAGIGPEIVLKLWSNSALFTQSRPVVVGDLGWLQRSQESCGFRGRVVPVDSVDPWPLASPAVMPCLQGTTQDLTSVELGRAQAVAGRAAYEFLKTSIDRTMRQQGDAIVTCPLHKEGLHAAGLDFPGHTEILAHETGTKQFAMMLYGGGIGVAHVTLHQSLRSIFDHITTAQVLEKITLTYEVMTQLLDRQPRIGVCALNPHASDGGLFGHEEQEIIEPAVKHAVSKGMLASGPWPSDTLFRRAKSGEFDGIVAMYHDQGHIALKLMAGFHLVNITLGLPIVRTSVAHGTAYDIVHRRCADEGSLLEAIRVAGKLVRARKSH